MIQDSKSSKWSANLSWCWKTITNNNYWSSTISDFQLQLIMFNVKSFSPEEIPWFHTHNPIFHHYQSFPKKPSFRIHYISHFYSLFTKAHCSTITHLFLPSVLCSFNCKTYLRIILKEIQRPNIYTSHEVHQPNFACISFFHHRCYMSFQSYLSWFNHPNNFTWRLHITMLLIM